MIDTRSPDTDLVLVLLSWVPHVGQCWLDDGRVITPPVQTFSVPAHSYFLHALFAVA